MHEDCVLFVKCTSTVNIGLCVANILCFLIEELGGWGGGGCRKHDLNYQFKGLKKKKMLRIMSDATTLGFPYCRAKGL